MRIITIFCFTTVLLAGTAKAQGPTVEAHGGLQGLHYKLSNGESQLQAGGGIGLGYHFPISKNWQILTGINADYYRTKAKLNDGTYTSNEVDESGSGFQYNVQTKGYEETQRFFAVSVPAKLQYTSNGQTKWYVNGGLKLVIPFSAKFEASAVELTQSGYYPDYNIEVKNMPQHGFTTTNNWTAKGSQLLNGSLASSIAAGLKFRLANKLSLSTGLYFDYGLTDMRTGDDKNTSFMTYNRGNIKPAGAMKLSQSAKLMAYGVQVNIGVER